MLDLQYIRENPEEVRARLASLHTETPLDRVLELDASRREVLQELEADRHRRNTASREVSRLTGDAREALIEEVRGLNERIDGSESLLRGLDLELQRALYELPNLPHPSVPVGADESQNRVVRREGEPRTAEQLGFAPRPHWELGPELGIIDFERGAKLAGSRFYVLLGAGARLQRALISWMLDLHVKQHGYTEARVPYMVREECMWGAGQLPKFAANIYHDAEDNMWFIGTAEIPLTNLHRDEILSAADLPRRYVAYSPCFRREKFSAGRDVRGIKRGHQFDKVEMYQFTSAHDSYAALETLVDNAEDICRALGIAHRVVEMVTGDLGFAAAKKYDVEMWAPGCGEWLEVSSCSNCEAFQARRANIRYRPSPGAKPEFVHTLNGSGLALPRTVIAILENFQQADGSVVVPEVLRPYLATARIARAQ